MVKQAHTPQHKILAMTHNGRLLMGSDDIKVDGKVYSKMAGFISSVNWQVKPWNPAEEEAEYRKAVAKMHRTCRPGGTDTIDGEAVDIILVTTRGEDGKDVDGRWWIARESGLPLKNEFGVANGDPGGETWDYRDVKAPDTTRHLQP
ncbi:MAG TPA: hypothetical protein VGF56_08430 [Rhizomicrobium sp.]|jgi:hypothetical protein